MKNKTSILIVSVFLLIPVLFFFHALFGNKTFIGTDIHSFFYPFKYMAAEFYKTGELHLWNPYLFSGMPAMAELQIGYFYPLNLIFAVFSLVRGMAVFIVVHLFLTSLFMYLYLKELKLGNLPSIFGALAFSYCGFSLLHVDQLSMLAVTTWLPLILLLIDRSYKQKGFLYPVLAAVVFGVLFLGGHPQVSVIIGFGIAFYVLFRMFDPFTERNFNEIKRRAWIAVLIAVIGLALASVSLFPFLEAYSRSLRATDNIESSSAIHVSPAEFQTFLIPELRQKGSERRMFGGTGETYAGIIQILLALFAVIFIKRKIVTFYFCLLLFSICSSLGNAFPLHFILYYLIPLYGRLQIPIRFLLLYAFSVSILSAIALDNISKMLPEFEKFIKWTAGTVVSLLLVFLLMISSGTMRSFFINVTEGGIRAPFIFFIFCSAFIISGYLFLNAKINKKVLFVLLISIALIDMLSFGTRFFKMGDISIIEQVPGFVPFLEQDKDLYRVSFGDQNIIPNNAIIYKIQSISGYTPVILKDFIHYVIFNSTKSLDFSGVPSGSRFYIPPDSDTKMTGLLNVKYHLFPIMQDGQYFIGIKDRINYYPRAFIVPNYQLVQDRIAILPNLGRDDFEPKDTLFLESEAGLSEFIFKSLSSGEAKITYYSSDKISINTNSGEDAFLFLSEMFYPGWKVYVDGFHANIYRANYIFRAVPLKAGNHEVIFVYDPFSFKLGKYISILTLILCFGLITRELVIRKQIC